jgi:hypothetical protein
VPWRGKGSGHAFGNAVGQRGVLDSFLLDVGVVEQTRVEVVVLEAGAARAVVRAPVSLRLALVSLAKRVATDRDPSTTPGDECCGPACHASGITCGRT